MYARVQILGRLGIEPDMRSTRDGREYCRLRIAANHRRLNKDTNEWGEQTSWFSVFLHGDRAQSAARLYKKGDFILVDGRISVDDEGRCDIWPNEVKLVPSGKSRSTENSDAVPAFEDNDIPF